MHGIIRTIIMAAVVIPVAMASAATKRKISDIDTTPLAETTKSKKLNDRMDKVRGIKNLDLITAGIYFNDYSANEVSADLKYKGKPFILNGRIGSISKDALGNIFIAFHGDKYGVKAVWAELFEEQVCGTKESSTACSVETRASQLKKGSGVFLDCFGKGMIMNTPIATSCLVRF